MKKVLMLSVVLAVAIMVVGCQSMCPWRGGCQSCGMAKDQPVAKINTAALKSLIDAGVPLTLVDARVGKYDDGRRISSALNLSPEAKDEEMQGLLKSKDALIVSYCANLKCPASKMLAARLRALGYKHVVEYPQGVEGWVAEGNPVAQATK